MLGAVCGGGIGLWRMRRTNSVGCGSSSSSDTVQAVVMKTVWSQIWKRRERQTRKRTEREREGSSIPDQGWLLLVGVWFAALGQTDGLGFVRLVLMQSRSQIFTTHGLPCSLPPSPLFVTLFPPSLCLAVTFFCEFPLLSHFFESASWLNSAVCVMVMNGD